MLDEKINQGEKSRLDLVNTFAAEAVNTLLTATDGADAAPCERRIDLERFLDRPSTFFRGGAYEHLPPSAREGFRDAARRLSNKLAHPAALAVGHAAEQAFKRYAETCTGKSMDGISWEEQENLVGGLPDKRVAFPVFTSRLFRRSYRNVAAHVERFDTDETETMFLQALTLVDRIGKSMTTNFPEIGSDETVE